MSHTRAIKFGLFVRLIWQITRGKYLNKNASELKISAFARKLFEDFLKSIFIDSYSCMYYFNFYKYCYDIMFQSKPGQILFVYLQLI